MDFTEDPFKDYRYEDPFNIEDPFTDAADSRRPPRSSSAAGFDADAFFALPPPLLNGRAPPRGGRVSAPPLAADPFTAPAPARAPAPAPAPAPAHTDSWAAWPSDNWAADDAWASPAAPRHGTHADTGQPADRNTDNWPNKSDKWANKDDWADWGADHNDNLNETWPSTTLPAKKEKSPKPVKYAKSLVHTIGGIGRSKQGKKAKAAEALRSEPLPSEEQQWAWAAAESRRAQAEAEAKAEARRRREDAELQLALALSRQDK